MLSCCLRKPRIILGRIEHSVKHMEELIQDLLNLSKISRESLQTSQVDLSRISEEIFAVT